jgi:DNA-binding MarR family transcriptional regulator
MDDDGAIRLRRVIIRIARELNASSTGAGLTPSQASVLALIVARGPLGVAELGELEGLNPTMLSRVISRLAAMGMIHRLRDPDDLRSVTVVSTHAGRAVHEQIKERRAAAVSRCLAMLPETHVKALADALPALEELAETMRQAGRAENARPSPG